MGPMGDCRDSGDAGGRDARPRRLLVVAHSRTGSTAELRDLAVEAAGQAGGDDVTVRLLGAFEAGPDDVLWAHGVLLATPANFGYMSGALKDFFERVYHRCLDRSAGLPYVLIVKGDTDVDGGVASVERIAGGMRWRRVLPPVKVVGPITDDARTESAELGAAFAAGLATGIF